MIILFLFVVVEIECKNNVLRYHGFIPYMNHRGAKMLFHSKFERITEKNRNKNKTKPEISFYRL